MFRQQMTRIVLVARYDEIKLPGSNNMHRIQLRALVTDTALYQVWEQGHKWFFLLTVISVMSRPKDSQMPRNIDTEKEPSLELNANSQML